MKIKQSVPKRRHIKFRRRGITQKKTYVWFILKMFIKLFFYFYTKRCTNKQCLGYHYQHAYHILRDDALQHYKYLHLNIQCSTVSLYDNKKVMCSWVIYDIRIGSNFFTLNCCVIYHINPFRSYIGSRPTVWFSSSAPMSEDVRHGFYFACSPAVGACPTLFLMEYRF
jgi:hypothetical protein